MKINSKEFRVAGKKKVNLDKWATITAPVYKSEDHYKDLLAEDIEELSALQQVLFASSGYALLIIFQAMDAAGKDGAISHLLTGVNPQGVEVHSFKHPSGEELEHDFLWRTNCRLPARGRIGVFNRSYYEEVLIVRVHPELLEGEGIPHTGEVKSKIWEHRYRSIVDLEKHLHRNGTRIVKFFLHLSKDEQRKRFLKRIDTLDKNWKFSQADVVERKFWDQYMQAYEACINATSTETSPWYVVPADDKYNARLIVSRVVIETLKDLKMEYPKQTRQRRRELESIRKQFEKQ